MTVTLTIEGHSLSEVLRLMLSSLAVSLASTALVPWVWWLTPTGHWLLAVSVFFAGCSWSTFALVAAEAFLATKRAVRRRALTGRVQECAVLGGDPP